MRADCPLCFCSTDADGCCTNPNCGWRPVVPEPGTVPQHVPPPTPPPRQGPAAHFDGGTYDPAHDAGRLRRQLGRVFEVMLDGRWYTLPELAQRAGGSEAGVSARVRDLRKPRFGGHVVDRRRRGPAVDGVWEYRLDVPPRVVPAS